MFSFLFFFSTGLISWFCTAIDTFILCALRRYNQQQQCCDQQVQESSSRRACCVLQLVFCTRYLVFYSYIVQLADKTQSLCHKKNKSIMVRTSLSFCTPRNIAKKRCPAPPPHSPHCVIHVVFILCSHALCSVCCSVRVCCLCCAVLCCCEFWIFGDFQ